MMVEFERKKIGKYWNHPSIVIQSSKIHGEGVFATSTIKKGEVVMVWEGHLFTKSEILKGFAKPDSVSGFNGDFYLGQLIDESDTVDQFLNHSCDPNLWMKNEFTLTARRDINSGEELTADYAMWETDYEWALQGKCKCGYIGCRRMITGNDWKYENLQKAYEGHFLPYINDRISTLTSVLLGELKTIV